MTGRSLWLPWQANRKGRFLAARGCLETVASATAKLRTKRFLGFGSGSWSCREPPSLGQARVAQHPMAVELRRDHRG